MSLTKQQIIDVENVLKNALRHKFQNYKPEPAAMPFHSRLLGKDKMALSTTLAENPKTKVQTLIAIPYNPYNPEPYNRWTIRGMLDLEKELKVANEFWDFLGGEGAYEDLLKCFERVGIELRSEIDDYFDKYNKK